MSINTIINNSESYVTPEVELLLVEGGIFAASTGEQYGNPEDWDGNNGWN